MKYQLVGNAIVTRTVEASSPAEAVGKWSPWMDRANEIKINPNTTILILADNVKVLDEDGNRLDAPKAMPAKRHKSRFNSPMFTTEDTEAEGGHLTQCEASG